MSEPVQLLVAVPVPPVARRITQVSTTQIALTCLSKSRRMAELPPNKLEITRKNIDNQELSHSRYIWITTQNEKFKQIFVFLITPPTHSSTTQSENWQAIVHIGIFGERNLREFKLRGDVRLFGHTMKRSSHKITSPFLSKQSVITVN